MVKEYTSRIVTIKAIRYNGNNLNEIKEFIRKFSTSDFIINNSINFFELIINYNSGFMGISDTNFYLIEKGDYIFIDPLFSEKIRTTSKKDFFRRYKEL